MSDCIFCQIAKKEIPSEFISDKDDFYVIKDISPSAPVHLLIIPKRHLESLSDISDQDDNLMGAMMREVKHLAEKFNINKSGYKVVINTGKDGGQEVPHLHIHLLGGKKLD